MCQSSIILSVIIVALNLKAKETEIENFVAMNVISNQDLKIKNVVKLYDEKAI